MMVLHVKNEVNNTWKTSFCEMLNQNHSDVNLNQNHIIFDEFLDSVITAEEVFNVLKLSKNWKSPGIDDYSS